MDHSQEAAGRFIVTRGHAAKLLEATEKAFHFIPVAVQVTVKHTLDQAAFFAWNHGVSPNGSYAGLHRIRIVGFVRQHVASALGRRQQLGHALTIGLLAGAEHHP